MKQTYTSAELKAMARECMLGKYGTAIALTFTLQAVSLGISLICERVIDSRTAFGLIAMYAVDLIFSLILYVFSVGTCHFYLNASREREINISDLFYGFRNNPDKAILIGLAFFASSLVCMIPFSVCLVACIITGNTVLMIAAALTLIFAIVTLFFIVYTYTMAFYLLADGDTASSVPALLRKSRLLMTGNRFRYFYLHVSFLGWILLGLLSCGIAYLWIIPYMNCTLAFFYRDISGSLAVENKAVDTEPSAPETEFEKHGF